MKPEVKRKNRIIRHQRSRAKFFGTSDRPRLSVFRSNKHLHLQLIDDTKGVTLVSASTKELKASGEKGSQAFGIAKLFAEKAKKQGVSSAVFDRGGYKYHGQIKDIAETIRESGIKI